MLPGCFCLTIWLLYLLGFRCVLSSVTWLFLSDNVVAVPVGVQVCSVMCYLAVFVSQCGCCTCWGSGVFCQVLPGCFCLIMWLLYLLGFRCVLSSVTWLFLSDNVVAVPVGVQECSVQCYLVVFV